MTSVLFLVVPPIARGKRATRSPPIQLAACAQSRENCSANVGRLLVLSSTLEVLPAPHSGSHFVRRRRPPNGAPFFEGWYVRAVLPNDDSFALMFSIEAKGIGTMQLAGNDDVVHYHVLRDLSSFRASPNKLRMRHVDTDGHGYELAAGGCHGTMPGGIKWRVRFKPLVSWGDRQRGPRATATRLSHLPAFEPGWQVLMGHGIAASGVMWYGGVSHDLRGARIYIEKNWGASFPARWWWVQANHFPLPDLTVTAVGATRQVLGREETLGMIAVHHDGVLYEFANWNSDMRWNVVWGRWEARCLSCNGYEAMLCASTLERGVAVRGPSVDGMVFNVRDAMRGSLELSVMAPDGTAILDGVRCLSAQVEVGGTPWDDGKVWSVVVPKLPRPLRALVNTIDANSACTT